jgi:hypothetical protein
MSFAFRFLKAPAPRSRKGKRERREFTCVNLLGQLFQYDADRVVGGLTYRYAYSYFGTQY